MAICFLAFGFVALSGLMLFPESDSEGFPFSGLKGRVQARHTPRTRESADGIGILQDWWWG